MYGSYTYKYNSNINAAATQMGLVSSGSSKTVYIKTVSAPSGGYIGTTINDITSTTSTSADNGFVFVDENGKEITEAKTTGLSGYSVKENGSYYFKTNGTSIVPTNTKMTSTVAKSYIELDLTGEYTKEDYIKVNVNANVSSQTNQDIGYAIITKSKDAPTLEQAKKGFIYISGEVSAKDYVELLQGGEKYYLHLGYIKDDDGDFVGSDIISFNSLSLEKLENVETVTIEGTVDPTEINGKQWYPYGTKVNINYPSATTGYYKYIYPDNTQSEVYTVTSSTKQIELQQTCRVVAGYTSECTGANKEFTVMANPNGISQAAYSENIGGIYPVLVTNKTTGKIYGSNTYRCDSDINTSATHMGLVGNTETVVYIKIIPTPAGGYKAETKNGITSKESTSNNNGYIFVTSSEEEIISPKASASIKDGTNSITTTVTATPQNGATISKYYYAIDSGVYEETNSSTYTFSGVDMLTPHTISVYVRDNRGAISAVEHKDRNVKPTITLSENPIKINEEEWYPYGTEISIKYANDMTGITGIYAYIDERNNDYFGEYTTNVEYKTPLYHSVTYIAKTQNARGEQTEEVRKTINIMPESDNNTGTGTLYYNDYVGNIYPVKVVGTKDEDAWGTGTYKYQSSINTAATHMGLVEVGEEKVVYVKIAVAPEAGYIGSTRNGVTTMSNSRTTNGFMFVTEDGEEISMPKIISAVVASGKDEITVTVTADSNMVKYYYSLDGINYTESTENKHTFAVLQSTAQIVRVYGIDNNGQQTPVKEITAIRKIPVPTITANAEGITTPDGEVWYPYGTQFSIVYANDMTGLTGKYKTTNMQTGTASNWQNATSSTSITLTETFKIDAYNYDAQGKEGELLSQIIYIMPNPENLQANYYEYCSGQTMPVMVTGRTGTGYGTDTYYNTPINVAAVHSNLVKAGEGPTLLYIKIVPCPEGGFKGSNKNGVQTQSLLEVHNGYQFVNK